MSYIAGFGELTYLGHTEGGLQRFDERKLTYSNTPTCERRFLEGNLLRGPTPVAFVRSNVRSDGAAGSLVCSAGFYRQSKQKKDKNAPPSATGYDAALMSVTWIVLVALFKVPVTSTFCPAKDTGFFQWL
jgi:hypothetical protein